MMVLYSFFAMSDEVSGDISACPAGTGNPASLFATVTAVTAESITISSNLGTAISSGTVTHDDTADKARKHAKGLGRQG